MADIHIGKSLIDKVKGIIKVQIYFHVPNTLAGNKYPGIAQTLDSNGDLIPVSIAPGVTVEELSKLKDGTLFEVHRSKPFPYDGSPERRSEIKTDIRGLWAGIAAQKQAELDMEYPFYGITVARIV